MEAEVSKKPSRQDLWVAIGLSLAAALAFYFSTKPTLKDLDYTLEIASAKVASMAAAARDLRGRS